MRVRDGRSLDMDGWKDRDGTTVASSDSRSEGPKDLGCYEFVHECCTILVRRDVNKNYDCIA